MQAWLQAQIDNGLPALAGTSITGTVPIKDELINELIAEVLDSGMLSGARVPDPDAMPLDRLVKYVRRATVHAGPGVVTVEFEIRV
jgi:hypothetical protein